MFLLIVFGGLALVLIGLIALGAWNPRSLAQLTGRSDERRWETQAKIEGSDIQQQVDAQNLARRRRGKPEISEAEIRARADASQRESIERGKRHAEGDEPEAP
jgi:hypothetical protein